MDPITLGLGGMASGLLGGIFGANAQADALNKQTELMKQLQAKLDAIPTPELKAVALEQLTQQGVITPEMETAIKQDPSMMQGIQVDQRLRDAQIEALNQLAGYSKGEMTQADKTQMQALSNEIAKQTAGQQGAVLQNLQARGLGGSGAELAAALSGIQRGATTEAQLGAQNQQQLQNRALQALAQGSNLAGQMENQQFNEAAQIAKAQDLINQYNTSAAQAVQQRNIAARNQAQAQNLGASQQIANQNVAIRNLMAQQPNQLAQQQYENELSKYGKSAANTQALSQLAGQSGQQQAQMYSGIGQGVGQGFGTLAQYAQQAPLQDAMTEYYKKKMSTL